MNHRTHRSSPSRVRVLAARVHVVGTRTCDFATLACVVGVPADAALGRLPAGARRSRRWPLLSAPALAAMARSVPGGRIESHVPGSGVRAELRVPGQAPAAGDALSPRSSTAPPFRPFNHLAPPATDVAGLGAGRVPVVPSLFGFGALAGGDVGAPAAPAGAGGGRGRAAYRPAAARPGPR
ncbi:hypothetical protein BFF78_39800 [Streptomyces fodineus]|uniref:Uncharacterized protein n=1 Tax=Streptomyces fodineus TaxID=1904616 RepID=A0A1D7YLK3_9ACTN|nr:hypothetical protein [Streptomyces fodineus]AOR36392.1 hypothetical protein BFF78_39800 [Streptomyces fodineus]